MITISPRYLKSKDARAYHPTCCIAAPKSIPELTGYVLRISLDYVRDVDEGIWLEHGNEWDKTQRAWRYMFEKEVKTPRHPSKRYRYTEDEVFIAYESDKSPTFVARMNKRIATFTKGSGKLVRAQYTESYDRISYRAASWLIIPNGSAWAYELDYDPMRDIGKRRISADGFQILESYDFDDIAVLHADEYKERLQQLLAEQNRLCELKPYRGDIDKKETIAQTIANDFYRRIPSEVRNEYEGYHQDAVHALLERFRCLAGQMERECINAIRNYQNEKLKPIEDEIKNLIGIEIGNGAEN